MTRKRGTIDRRLGIQTSRKEKMPDGPGIDPLYALGRDYEPTPVEVFEAVMADVSFEPEGTRFFDVGAGKGRVLCLAAGWPFRSVDGIELVPSWAQIARKNLKSLDEAYVQSGPQGCATGDAGNFRFPEDAKKLVFAFNPFGPRVLRRVLRNLRESSRRHPTEIAYYEPVHASTIDHEEGWARQVEGRHWTIWRSMFHFG